MDIIKISASYFIDIPLDNCASLGLGSQIKIGSGVIVRIRIMIYIRS